jgi:RNA polymerase sigma factor (sigma-70 family)
MAADTPPDLAVLLNGSDPATKEREWAGFLSRYSRLLLKAANAMGGDYDARMDRYRYVIDALAADDCRRLRAYQVTARSTFPAWLTVVARRLCVDFERSRYGRTDRPARENGAAASSRRARRLLAGLNGDGRSPEVLTDENADPDAKLRTAERRRLVEEVLAGLDPRDRLLLRLRYDDDLAIRQIAEVMGFPTVFHVYRRLGPLLADVRRRLEARGITDDAF